MPYARDVKTYGATFHSVFEMLATRPDTAPQITFDTPKQAINFRIRWYKYVRLRKDWIPDTAMILNYGEIPVSVDMRKDWNPKTHPAEAKLKEDTIRAEYEKWKVVADYTVKLIEKTLIFVKRCSPEDNPTMYNIMLQANHIRDMQLMKNTQQAAEAPKFKSPGEQANEDIMKLLFPDGIVRPD